MAKYSGYSHEDEDLEKMRKALEKMSGRKGSIADQINWGGKKSGKDTKDYEEMKRKYKALKRMKGY